MLLFPECARLSSLSSVSETVSHLDYGSLRDKLVVETTNEHETLSIALI